MSFRVTLTVEIRIKVPFGVPKYTEYRRLLLSTTEYATLLARLIVVCAFCFGER